MHSKVNMEQPMVGGTVTSEPGFTPALNATFEGTGNDYIRNDPDGKRMRLNAHGVLKTHDDAVSNSDELVVVRASWLMLCS